MIVVSVCSSTKSPSMSHSFSKICRLVRIIRGFFTNRNRVRYSFGVKSRDSPARDALCSEKSIFKKPSFCYTLRNFKFVSAPQNSTNITRFRHIRSQFSADLTNDAGNSRSTVFAISPPTLLHRSAQQKIPRMDGLPSIPMSQIPDGS